MARRGHAEVLLTSAQCAYESLKHSRQAVLVPERKLRTVATRESFRKPALAGMSKKGLNQDPKMDGEG